MKYLPLISALIPFVALIFCAGLMVYYRLKKKFKQDRSKNKLELIDSNIVEIFIFIMYIALAAPDWGGLITNLFGGG